MGSTRPLRELYKVSERFRRSVNVAADFGHDDALDGYVITSLSKAILLRISAGLAGEARSRAWSITGPYGAGKSACGLFVAKQLAYPVNSAARMELRGKDVRLCQDLLEYVPGLQDGGFAVVPVVGSRQPLSLTLLAGLIDTVRSISLPSEMLQEHMAWLQELYHVEKTNVSGHPTDLALAVQRTAEMLRREDRGILGLLILYDELGKSLEYVALHPERGDVGILQILAEMASRSEDPIVGLVTVLHQAFGHYAATLSPIQQREWAKVQGRFEDIGFLESAGELLTLIDEAIQPLENDEKLEQAILREVDEAASLNILPKDLNAHDAHRVLLGCAPLHPSVSLVLGRLFRSRLAQNERSLFAFLSSGEPCGFQDYLTQTTWSNNGYGPFYRLDRLYDYVLAALGSGLHAHSQGKRWAEIADALERLPEESSQLEARLVKIIGMLGLLGDQRHLRASEEMLCYAAGGGRVCTDDVREALAHLVDWGIALYRRFKDAYSLWQGSDVDLDELWEQGLGQIEHTQSLALLLQESGQLKPYLAKRHLHETGTFRFLTPWVIDLEELERARTLDLGQADGAVVFVLPPLGLSLKEVCQQVMAFSDELPGQRRETTLFAIPRHTQGIREAFEENLVWEWVAENTPELEGDSIGRRELSARRLAARARLARATSHCFEMASSYASCIWIWQGEQRVFTSARQLTSMVSDMCDAAYASAPIVKNELINRRSLSSAASAARRALIERMLIHGSEERLGLTGYPPEVSVYLSILRASGLHHEGEGAWMFGPPTGDDACNVVPLWQAIDGFLDCTEAGGRGVTELYDIMRKPPFGIKDGLLPIYLTVALLHWKNELALYEEGTFVPEPRPAELERLLRVPERFSVRRYRLDTARSRLLYEYSVLLGDTLDPSQISILTAVRPLIAFAKQLPQFTMMTESLSVEAVAVREALLNAREPQPLLFETLPYAVGHKVTADAGFDVAYYMDQLKRALLELQQAYGRLLDSIQHGLQESLLLPDQQDKARREIGQRCRIIQEWVTDLELKPFVLRLADARLPTREWLESVAAGLVHKPPKQWNDGDVARFRVALHDMAGRFYRTEEAALDANPAPDGGRVLRVGITDASGRELRQMVHITPEDEASLERTVKRLEEALDAVPRDQRMRLMALAELTRRLLAEGSDGENGHA